MSDFYISVKSTLDRVAIDIADGLGIGFVELDDTLNVEMAISSSADMIVYQMIGMSENPMDPLWLVDFAIGAKTNKDPANYDLAVILSAIKTVIKKGVSIPVMDYSAIDLPPPEPGDPPNPVATSEGYLYITDSRVDPQMFDGAAGIRMLAVHAAGVRYGS